MLTKLKEGIAKRCVGFLTNSQAFNDLVEERARESVESALLADKITDDDRFGNLIEKVADELVNRPSDEVVDMNDLIHTVKEAAVESAAEETNHQLTNHRFDASDIENLDDLIKEVVKEEVPYIIENDVPEVIRNMAFDGDLEIKAEVQVNK